MEKIKYTYTIPLDELTGEPSKSVILRSDGAWIPTDPANSDYQRYLRWLENPDAEEQILPFTVVSEEPAEEDAGSAE